MTQVTTIKLEDAESSRIRWTDGKRGFVPRLEFQPRYGRRGARPVRPVRGHAKTTRLEAERTLEHLAKNYVSPIRERQVVEVDHLGRVLAVHVLTEAVR